MRILVCGGRNYDNKEKLFKVLNKTKDRVTLLIHGGARGADSLAGEWAKLNNIPCDVYPAEWNKYGNRAGSIRNKEMLLKSLPDVVIAFPGGIGTNHMCGIAQDANVVVVRIK